jgi:hypothetical protein
MSVVNSAYNDAYADPSTSAAQIGSLHNTLPKSFTGGPRDMKSKLDDALARCRADGKPTFFITMVRSSYLLLRIVLETRLHTSLRDNATLFTYMQTANPNWPEIKANIPRGHTVNDRPDIVARVFHLKLNELLDDLIKKQVLGRVVNYCYTIEYQKVRYH